MNQQDIFVDGDDVFDCLNTKFAEMVRIAAEYLDCEIRDLNVEYTICHIDTGRGFGGKAIAH